MFHLQVWLLLTDLVILSSGTEATLTPCKPCVDILPPSDGGGDDTLPGTYRLVTGLAQGCPENCSYKKDGESPEDIWCLKPGQYPYEDTCKTTGTTGMSETSGTSETTGTSDTTGISETTETWSIPI